MTINDMPFDPPRFLSGELRMKHDYVLSFVKNNHVDIVYNNDTISLFELLALIRYYSSKNIKIDLTLTYLPYQRMNHAEGEEVETVKFVAEIFNSLKLESLKICEPHCKLNHFKNAKPIKIVEKIYQKVKKLMDFNEDNDVLVFTDKGAMEKYSHIGKNHIFASKTRNKETGFVESYSLSGTIKPN